MLGEAKRNEREVNAQLQDIEADQDLSPEGKEHRAQEVIDRFAPGIVENYRAAREKTKASAETSFLFSLPFVDGKTFASGAAKIADTSEMLAVQNEASALAARIGEARSREKEKADRSRGRPWEREPSPSVVPGEELPESPSLATLRKEFDAAMELGGTEGRVRALAVARVCERMGMDLEVVVDRHRKQTHRNALVDAARFERGLATIPSGTRVAQNPFASSAGAGSRRRGQKGIGNYRGDNKPVAGSDSRQIFQKTNRRPSWK